MAVILPILQQRSSSGTLWIWTFALVLFLVAFVAILLIAIRRHLRPRVHPSAGESSGAAPRTNNPAVFMTASMQAVIQKLRDQEKELEALHQREKERAQQTERLSEAVTRNMPAGLVIVNASGIVTSANPAAEAALGVRSLAFRRYTELFGLDSVLSKLLAGCLERSETCRREELEYVTPSGDVRQLGVTISPILSGPETSSGALCLLSDLTELKVLQKQMQLRESLASLGVLSAGIAHEFKNSLATISGYAQMIRSEARDVEAAENAAKIVEQTRALTHVVTEFLKFARPLELADEDVPMRDVAERVIEEVHQGLPEVAITCDGEFLQVTGDESLLRQALLNLTRNAAEAAASKAGASLPAVAGRVTLRGAIEHHAAGVYQRLIVHDNGPGIPAEELPKVFMPFYTTKSGGTGLGLAIVQKIIVQHGGRVEARNAPEGGAEFIIWLPARAPAIGTVESASARA